ncbi:MAG: ribonuclease, partial [Bradyrhizobium sp.]|nr:ribonuclease [Bradyrhizobium sp.]
IVADTTVSAQQSFVIDRGEQVHTLEAAKALLAAQVAAFPTHVEEAVDDDEPFDVEAEVETEETLGLVDDQPGAEAGDGSETDADGRKRKRRRRRRGRGEAREGGPAREEHDVPRVASDEAETVGAADGDSDDGVEDGAADGEARADQAAGGERRPRRRGRRGGRRRRGGPEDGLAGSIADELGPTSASEASGAVADFDGYPPEPAPAPEVRPESVARAPEQQPEPQPVEPRQPDPVRTSSESETAQEAERAARRRSTVREKVSFLVNAQPEAATSPPAQSTPPEPPAPAAPEPAPVASEESQPRRAGWWSRRFGGGE